jgi:hypothetical protein
VQPVEVSFRARPAGRQLGVDMANNFMLMTFFGLIADTAEDQAGHRRFSPKSETQWLIEFEARNMTEVTYYRKYQQSRRRCG